MKSNCMDFTIEIIWVGKEYNLERFGENSKLQPLRTKMISFIKSVCCATIEINQTSHDGCSMKINMIVVSKTKPTKRNTINPFCRLIPKVLYIASEQERKKIHPMSANYV